MVFDKPIPELKVADLDSLYTDGEDCDKRTFAEQRTNLQLVSGEHYVREGSKFWNRIRDNKALTNEQRIKLTKNHIQRVTKIYRNQIEQSAPGIQCVAANERELSDQKAAELNQAYYEYMRECEDLDTKKATWIKNFIEIGEVCVKVFWDPDQGKVNAYEAKMQPDPNHEEGQTDENGDDVDPELVPELDEWGDIQQDESKPVYGGKIVFETFEAFNLRRDRSARTMAESPYLILSKLLPRKALRSMLTSEDDIRKFSAAPFNEWTVFDNNTGQYRAAQDQCLVKEIYFRPGAAIPNGYFFIYTDQIVIAKGELPFGIFPIIHEGFDEQTGNPRSHSVIRHCRPAQIEINRCASKIAEHQVTLGDDKAWIPANTKVSQGALLPGVRINTYTGVEPTITQGRTGDQYLPYLESQVDELYKLANLDEVVQESPNQADMYSNLMASYKFKNKFAIYGSKFERFYIRVIKTALQVAKHSVSEEELVPAIGRSEYISIAEFKNTKDLNYQIKIKARSEDIESQFGKQLTLNHLIQYVGPNLAKEDIGMMIRQSPFLNEEEMFSRFTQKYDNITNDILAMDRGTFRPPRQFDDHAYIIEALTNRMSKGDFERLPFVIQQLYQRKLQMHEQAKAQQLQDIQRSEAGFIPSGGYLVACDFYIGAPGDPTNVKRVRIPSESLSWLIDKLKSQGSQLDQMQNLPMAAQAQIGQMTQQQQPATAGGGASLPQQGNQVPPRVVNPQMPGGTGQSMPGRMNAAA